MLPTRRAVSVVLVYTICACSLAAGEAATVKKKLRSMKYTARAQQEAIAWQKDLRSQLAGLLKMGDQVSRKAPAPLRPKTLSVEKRAKYVFKEMEIDSTPGRRIKIVLTLPTNLKGPFPAVVAVAGHGGTRHTCYESARYSRCAHVLAERGYVTISTRVSQHKVSQKGRTLMGERLWDLMRCVDLLASLEEVDSQRIGCAGNSLGGEMVMWLGAMDRRIKAAVSAGFLTRMDQMEKNHCMCWKFPGLRELVDFADIYSLAAPRALLCQNGLKEPPSQFPVSLARKALRDIEPIYADFKRPDNLSFVAHKGGHEIDLPSLLAFFEKHLGTHRPSSVLSAPSPNSTLSNPKALPGGGAPSTQSGGFSL